MSVLKSGCQLKSPGNAVCNWDVDQLHHNVRGSEALGIDTNVPQLG